MPALHRACLCNNHSMQISIVDAASLPAEGRQRMAQILVDAFGQHWPGAWPTLEEALEELEDFKDPERICRAALDADGRVLGWIGGIPEYDGHVWELHPLAVDPPLHGQGIGRALVQDFEAQVRARGGGLVMLGSDDENDMTSLAGQDLFPDPLQKLAAIQALKPHPFVFYQKLGYALIGVVPDANGPGKPDILMGKRIS